MPSTPPPGPKPDDANKKNERDASDADKRTIANVDKPGATADPTPPD
jgi:hypothetical protein